MPAGPAHLVRRFLGSLAPVGPSRRSTAWVDEHLRPGEAALWRTMGRADRRHSVAVAHRVKRALGPEATRPVLAAALLHDVGKTMSGFGTFGRVGATVVAEVAGRPRAVAWAERRGPLGRVGRYVAHPRLGAELLAGVGSDPLTVAWTREHHLPPDQWSVPPSLGRALSAADDD